MILATHIADSSWKGCYIAAIFQDDTTKLPGLVAHAESEIVARARSLFEAPGDHAGELRALHNALRMLQVLKKAGGPTSRPEVAR